MNKIIKTIEIALFLSLGFAITQALVMTAAPLAGLLVLFSLSVLLAGRNILSLPIEQIQTLAFLTLVFGGQGTVYLVRERGHFWNSRPSRWMLLSSGADPAVVSLLATKGLLMAPLSPVIVAGLLLAIVVYLFVVDNLKVTIFRRFGVAQLVQQVGGVWVNHLVCDPDEFRERAVEGRVANTAAGNEHRSAGWRCSERQDALIAQLVHGL